MEIITEAMLAVLLRKRVVTTVALTLQRTKGPLKRTAWGVEAALSLPETAEKVAALFAPTRTHPIRIQPASLIERLGEAAERGERQVWAKLVPHRQTIGPKTARVRTVASLDRFITHLRELGARNISIEIHLGAKQ